jgi:threonine dehydrogenase-like Zn-dependent dehydrogenase
VLTGPERIELREIPEPVAGPAEVPVRVRAVGICGTDLSIFRGKIPVAYPRVMGHEVVGEVVAAIDGGPEPGTRVLVDPIVACGRCERCREGRGNICPDGWLLGRDRDGALQEVVAVPVPNLYRVPDGLDDHLVPLVQVLTTCVHGQRRVRILPGESVVVVGLGVTGLLHVQLAKAQGASRVVGVTRSPARLELARDLGADATVPGDDPSAAELVRAETDGGADVVIECAGTVATLGGAFRMVRPGGRVLAYGTIAEAGGPFPFYDLYYKELEVVGARAALPEDFPVAVDAITDGSVRLDALVARRIPLGGIGEELRSASVGGLKTIVHVGSAPSVDRTAPPG